MTWDGDRGRRPGFGLSGQGPVLSGWRSGAKGNGPRSRVGRSAAGAGPQAAAGKPQVGDDWAVRHAETLSQLPADALPPGRFHGEKSWTPHGSNGSVIEGQLTNAKFYVKKVGHGGAAFEGSPSVPWRAAGPADAWERAKSMANWAA